MGISPEDIRDLLVGFAAAIELDQIRIDAMPPENFHPEYDDGMWRRWRRNHLEYIDQLLATVPAIPSDMLEDLTLVALTYESGVIEHIALDRFADAASGSCAEGELETAVLFFGWLIKTVAGKPQEKLISCDARARMGQPSGFVN